MAHLALRRMEWGTSKGTIQLAIGAEIPETENVAFHRLDGLWRRKWITDAEGRVFGKQFVPPPTVETKAENDPDPETPPPAPDESPEPARWTRARLNDLGKDELKDTARGFDVAIYGTKDEIVERIMAKQREG